LAFTCAFSLIAACTNEAEAFCRDATTQLCARCYQCGGDDRANSNRCGLSVETNEAGCRTILRRVCSSDGALNYTPPDAQRCLDALRALSCDQRQPAQHVRDACGPFF
jgi:hypothetical protein